MLPYLQPIKGTDYDALYFLPDEEKMHIEAAQYKETSESIENSKMGNKYHIILIKESEEGFTDLDKFEAILSCPLEYASHLIPSGWYGVIARKTSTSYEFSEEMYNKLSEAVA